MTHPVKQRHDERNLARLNLILAQNRTTLEHWKKEIVLDALGTIRVECRAPAGRQVPHGIDNDVLLALVSAAVVQGVEPGGLIRLTASELLRLSNLSDSGRAYRQIKDILYRLRESNFRVQEGWYEGSKHRVRSAAFSIVSEFYSETVTDDPNPKGQWQAQTRLVVRLGSELLESLRAGFIRTLDTELLEKLQQPMSRNVYRALSMLQQTAVEEQQKPVLDISLSLIAWAEHLGLTHQFDPRDLPRLVERALTPAHKDLQSAGYLTGVVITGRGRNKTVTYQIAAAELRPANPKVAQLLARVLPERKALELSRQYSAERVRDALGRLERLLENGYKARSKEGLFIDILRDPERYHSKSLPAAPAKPAPARPATEAEPPEVTPSRQSFDVLATMLPETSRALKDRLWKLYEAKQVTTLQLLELKLRSAQEIEAQLQQWEQ